MRVAVTVTVWSPSWFRSALSSVNFPLALRESSVHAENTGSLVTDMMNP